MAEPQVVPVATVPQHIVRPPFPKRFPVRVTALYAVPVYAILVVVAFVAYQRGVATEMAALQGRLHSIVVVLSQIIPAKVATPEWTAEDREGVRAMVRRIAAAEPDVSSIYVLFPTGKDDTTWQFASDWTRSESDAATLGQLYDASQAPKMRSVLETGQAQVEDEIYADEWGPTLSGYGPIFDANHKAVAIVGCDVTGDRVYAIKSQVLRTTAIAFGIAFLSITGIGLIVGQTVRIPIDSMIRVTDSIGKGVLDQRANIARDDEFGILGRHLDRMAQGLQEREYIRGMFGRYMSEGLARKILASPEGPKLGGEEREVTVLFSDIRSYSTISEQLTPTQVVTMLNEYMGAMSAIVDDNGGVVIEFLGDAILAAFGAPETVEDHAEKAVRCARAMDAKLQLMNQEWERNGIAKLWQEAGIPELQARIGVHTGRVVAGNMGGPTRVKYAVIGDAVNVASRVENLNNALGTRLLVTQTAFDKLPAALQAEAIAKGEHPLKGREQHVHVYTFTLGGAVG